MRKLFLFKDPFPDQTDSNVRTFFRTSVRAVVWDQTKLLMMYSRKHGDFSFPGGGVEANESMEHALARELREETGYKIFRILEPVLTTEEFRKSRIEGYDYFHMLSTYYRCTIDPDPEPSRLTDEEGELGIEARWANPGEAYDANLALMRSGLIQECPWVERETRVLELLIGDFPRGLNSQAPANHENQHKLRRQEG